MPAPVRLFHLIDAKTGESVPYYDIGFYPNVGSAEGAVSGDRIVFTSDHAGIVGVPNEPLLPTEDFTLSFLDCATWRLLHPDGLATVKTKLPAVSEQPELLQVRLGPTFRLRLSAEHGIDTRALSAGFQPPDHGRVPVQTAGRVSHVRAPVRWEGGHPWIRFSSLGWDAPSSKAELEALSEDGLWMLYFFEPQLGCVGRAAVGSLVGIQPEEVLVELYRTCSLRGLVRGSDGPLPNRAMAVLMSRTGAPPVSWSKDASVTAAIDNEGAFEIAGVLPGTYVVEFISEGYQAEQRVVDIDRAPISLDVTLQRADASAIRVSGSMQSQSGLFNDPLLIQLRGERWYETPVHWRRGNDGHWVGDFKFADVEPGSYVLAPDPLGGFYDPPLLNTVAPADGLMFRVLDRIPRSDLIFRVYDAQAMIPLEVPAVVSILTQAGIFNRQGTGTVVHPAYREDGFEWLVTAEGYIPAYGFCSELFRESDSMEERRLSVDVLLEPGWGALVRLLDSRGPVAGVGILLDGELVGHTGEDGKMLIRSSGQPQSIAIEANGRQFSSESAGVLAKLCEKRQILFTDIYLSD